MQIRLVIAPISPLYASLSTQESVTHNALIVYHRKVDEFHHFVKGLCVGERADKANLIFSVRATVFGAVTCPTPRAGRAHIQLKYPHPFYCMHLLLLVLVFGAGAVP